MKTIWVRTGLLSFVILSLFTQLSCGSKEPPQSKSGPVQPRVVLKELRPEGTKVSQAFNRQPNGEAAIVCVTENGSPGVIILFNEEQLETAYGDSTWVSAFVPKKYYQTPGEIKVSLLDTKANQKSNTLTFKVEP